jgi:purine-binding chemotaxis protein CheW
MAIQQVCTFFLNNIYFGIEVEDVREIIRQQPLTRIPLAPPDICGLMNLRGQVLPVVDLPCRLGLQSISCNISEHVTYNIIVDTDDDVVSFIVDDVGDVLHCASETFEPPPANLNSQIRFFLKGAYKLDQGFLLILNTTKILDPLHVGYPLN